MAFLLFCCVSAWVYVYGSSLSMIWVRAYSAKYVNNDFLIQTQELHIQKKYSGAVDHPRCTEIVSFDISESLLNFHRWLWSVTLACYDMFSLKSCPVVWRIIRGDWLISQRPVWNWITVSNHRFDSWWGCTPGNDSSTWAGVNCRANITKKMSNVEWT